MDWLIICTLLIIIVLQILFRPKKDNTDTQNELKRLLDEMQRSFERIEKNFREDFRLNREEGRIVARDNREELTRSMNEFREAFDRGIASFNNLQREKFANLDEQQRMLVANTEKRLEEIRVTVDEKLQKTLNVVPPGHRTTGECTERTRGNADTGTGCRRPETGIEQCQDTGEYRRDTTEYVAGTDTGSGTI